MRIIAEMTAAMSVHFYRRYQASIVPSVRCDGDAPRCLVRKVSG